ncbi:putative transmembrane protein [Photobacterium aphoticum]|uniref:Putative transmembrane protein n=1 Tax=Photobacterium aphoticum TaxID=754436 RepID=A0A090R4A2_9GAMM|nr:putative transmembrane protein [Photobacterium aphoticum]
MAGVPAGYVYAKTASQNLPQTESQTLTLAALQQRLAAQTLVRGDFVQTRHMAMFNAPLVSSGHFLLAQDQGLQWQQTVPFLVSLILTQDKLSQQFADNPAQVWMPKTTRWCFISAICSCHCLRGIPSS